MHAIGYVLHAVFGPLLALASMLSPPLAKIAGRAPMSGDFALAALVVTAGVMGVACCFWAAWEHGRFVNYRKTARSDQSRARGALLLRDAFIDAGREAIVAMGIDMSAPLSFGGGSLMLQACLSGSDNVLVAAAIDALLKQGTAFEAKVRSREKRFVNIRGLPIGRRAVLFLSDVKEPADAGLNYRAVLDVVPHPIWVRDDKLSLRWANRAFLATTSGGSLDEALSLGIALDKSEKDLAAAALESNQPITARRYAAIGSQRRALSMTLERLPDAGVAGVAVDVTDATQADAKLRLTLEANVDLLDRLTTAVAVFGADRRLMTYNRAYARLWDLSADWLDTQPRADEILDRLREKRRLPEQRDFAAWKRLQIEMFDKLGPAAEQLWHLPNGASIRVVAYPHPLGGLAFLFDDVGEMLRLESSHQSMVKTQKATLDALGESIAVFGADGRLRLHNKAFEEFWGLTPSDLADKPHLRRIAEICAARVGQDGTWEIVSSGVNSAEPERYNEWGTLTRADGKLLSISMSRLPDGATLATFSDLTDYVRFDNALREHPGTAA
jgi:PAS domain-containing protein